MTEAWNRKASATIAASLDERIRAYESVHETLFPKISDSFYVDGVCFGFWDFNGHMQLALHYERHTIPLVDAPVAMKLRALRYLDEAVHRMMQRPDDT